MTIRNILALRAASGESVGCLRALGPSCSVRLASSGAELPSRPVSSWTRVPAVLPTLATEGRVTLSEETAQFQPRRTGRASACEAKVPRQEASPEAVRTARSSAGLSPPHGDSAFPEAVSSPPCPTARTTALRGSGKNVPEASRVLGRAEGWRAGRTRPRHRLPRGAGKGDPPAERMCRYVSAG